jgi:hypothetical protein
LNEWGFAAEIKSWWDHECHEHPEWGLFNCRVEETVPGSKKRSDLFLQGQHGAALCGELRLPDHLQPSPWHPDNMLDAINKATTHGSRWAFTSDATTLLLLDTSLTGPPPTRVVQEVDLLSFVSRSELDSDAFLSDMRRAWVKALHEIAPTVAGLSSPRGMAADAQFISSLRALLSGPVAAIRNELNARRAKSKTFEHQLVLWMVDEQGWTHAPDNWEPEVLRASQLTVYVFTTRLMFYDALRRSHPTLPELSAPKASAPIAEAMFRAYFAEARDKSGDYETIFTWDRVCQFALLSDAAVSGWARVVAHLALFDVSHIGYDILGRMFERLIDPHERYRWGQHYTSSDVVDLMLSFAIPDGIGRILDPAVGGGTFLVRAYVRKKHLAPTQTHQAILRDLYGIDVSGFAASLATINLAVRSLDFSENYPQVCSRSFFSVDPSDVLMALPAPKQTRLGVGVSQVALDSVRAVVCNPPYVRLHELGRDRVKETSAVLRRARHGRIRVPEKLHGLTNYHVYFWFHGAQFLQQGGRLVIITAGEWMDSDYGVSLQEWLLDNFVVECFIESLAEPWFSEARVGTVVTVARHCESESERISNNVRFVMLRRTLQDLYGPSCSGADQLSRVDALRDRILSLPEGHGESDDMDWSVVAQSQLREIGTVVADGD